MLRSFEMNWRTSISFSSAADSAMCFPFTFGALEIRTRIVFQIRRFDRRNRERQFAVLRCQYYRFAAQPNQDTAMRLAAGDLERGHDPRALAGKALVVAWPNQRPFKSRRLDLERVRQIDCFERAIDTRCDALAGSQIDAAIFVDGDG